VPIDKAGRFFCISCRNAVGISRGSVLSMGQLLSEVGVDGKSYKRDDGEQG
jgi:hypothetical protein